MPECKNIDRLFLLLLASIALLLVLINNNYSLKDYRYYTATAHEQKILNFLITLVQNKPTTGEVAVG